MKRYVSLSKARFTIKFNGLLLNKYFISLSQYLSYLLLVSIINNQENSMKKIIFVPLIMVLNSIIVFAQNDTANTDSLKIKNLNEVIITSNRIPVKLGLNSSATSIVASPVLGTMNRTIAVDEALRLVPGVRIDNQANGSRVHMSMRGQGILSERGLRGIKVMIDGIPFNDPSGFASDLYDVDWATVESIEVLRGSSSALYGGSASAGVLNIQTQNGGDKPINGQIFSSIGSNGFGKGLFQIDGTKDNLNYRISYSATQGNGYRDHTRFWSSNLSEKVSWTASPKVKLTQVLFLTDYFNQNAEGLNIDQVNENPLQANPDANPFNEYQKTGKITTGLTGDITLATNQNLQFTAFIRSSKYKETSNKAAQYRDFLTPGFSAQYSWKVENDKLKNTFCIGSDLQWQTIAEHKFKSLNDTNRIDSFDETNLEDTIIIANQTIDQRSIGFFISNVTEFNKKFSLSLSMRYDNMHNELTDKLSSANNLSGIKDFDQFTARAGVAYSFNNKLNAYANWGMGFIPPATEELASNPVSYGGFNQHLVPATSMSQEIGVRGSINDRLYYDINAFLMNTKDDFFRFKLTPARGNQEVFYGNCGESERKGVETFLKWNPIDPFTLQMAYTFSDFKYTNPDSISGQFLPNSPQHQLNVEAEYKICKRLTIGISTELQSKWYIFTDPTNYNISQDGFNLYHARVTYNWNLGKLKGDLGVYMKNITDKKYIAFTEPDPDLNAYQPGSGREIFVNIRMKF